MQRIAALLERVDALPLREWLVAAAVLSLVAAIAWIGRNVGRLIEAHEALSERVRIADEFIARVDEAVAKRVRTVELRQDRLQSRVENAGKNWGDSILGTQRGQSGELTKIDWRKPE